MKVFDMIGRGVTHFRVNKYGKFGSRLKKGLAECSLCLFMQDFLFLVYSSFDDLDPVDLRYI
jgi:hypothetical protein